MYKKVIKEIEQMWNEGKLAKEIAQKMNMNQTAIYAYVNSHRDVCPKRIGRYMYNPKTLEKMWQEGKTAKEIAKKLRIKVFTVYEYSRKHRSECPPRFNMKKSSKKREHSYDAKLLEKMWQKGIKADEIAKELKISKSTVYSYAQNHRDVCQKRKSSYDRKNMKSCGIKEKKCE